MTIAIGSILRASSVLARVQSPTQAILRSSFHTTQCLDQKRAGRHKISIKGDKPITYEQANKPDQIGHRKSFNAFNTCSLDDGIRKAECAHEDILIRKFVHGTWPGLLASDIVIKRRANQILLTFMCVHKISPTKIYFLIGYTEEILSYILKCVVKLQPECIWDERELIFKYI